MSTAAALLSEWNFDLRGTYVTAPDDTRLTEMRLRDAMKWIDLQGGFADDCCVFMDPDTIAVEPRMRIRQMGAGEPVRDLKLCLLKNNGGMTMNVGGAANRIFVGRYGHSFNCFVNIWDNSHLAIGDHATCNFAKMILSDAEIIIGSDCMLSEEIILQGCDQHGVVDLASGKIINAGRERTCLGEHVWVGRRSMILPGCNIGPGSIVGAGAVVTSDVAACVACAGVPAKVIRQNVSWSRHPKIIGKNELSFSGRG